MRMIGKFYSLLALSIMVAPPVYAAAGDQTVSVGYAHVDGGFAHDAYLKNKADYNSRLKNIPDGKLLSHNSDSEKDPQGFFVCYRYEFDDIWGIMGSVNYASSSMSNNIKTRTPEKEETPKKIDESMGSDIKSQYVSLLVGPTIRANDWVSAFGLLGVAYQKFDNSIYYNNKNEPSMNTSRSSSSNQTSFAYALGLQFNAYKNFVIDAAWTGTDRGNANRFNVGIGYKF